MDNLNKRNNRDLRNKAYINLLLLLITISLFVTATFAWFTDSAFSKGNKVFAGNLYVDVIATEQEVVDKYNLEYNANLTIGNTHEAHETIKNTIVDAYGYEPYIKKYRNPYFENATNTPDEEEFVYDYYYIITDEEAATMNLYNVEPGQFKVASIHYLNSGDLAFRAAGAIKIDTEVLPQGDGQPDRVVNKSYTGLENLNRQFKDGEDFYKNNYAVITDEETGNQYIDPLLIYNSNNGIKAKHQGSEIPEEEHVEPTNDSLQSKTPKDKKFYSITKAKYDSFEDASNAFIDYEYRFNKLLAMQASKVDGVGNVKKLKAIDADPYVVDDDSFKGYINNGGHLEDVLEVYIIPTSNLSGSITPATPIHGQSDIFTPGRTDVINPDKEKTMNIRDMLLDKSNGYFFGTVRQFNHLMTFGYIANQNLEGVYEDSLDIDGDYVLLKDGSEVDRTIATPEEEYKYLYEDAKKDLYTDYQKYLENVGGYCLPKDVLKGEDDCYPYNIDNSTIHTATSLSFDDQSKKVKVKVYEDDGSDDFYFANELGNTRIAIYMPDDVNSKYQNASISLKYGVTASQLEFEMDDTGYMLYDRELKEKEDKELKPGKLVSITVPAIITKNEEDIKSPEETDELVLRVISVDDNYATFMMLNELKDSDYYYRIKKPKVTGILNASLPYVSDFENSDGHTTSGINYYNSEIDRDLEVLYAGVTNNTSCLTNDDDIETATEDYNDFMYLVNQYGLEDEVDKLAQMFGSIVEQPVNQKMYNMAANISVDSLVEKMKSVNPDFADYYNFIIEEVDSTSICDHSFYLSNDAIEAAKKAGLNDFDETTFMGYVNDGYTNTYSGNKKRHFRSLTLDDIFAMFSSSDNDIVYSDDIIKALYGSKTSANKHNVVLADAVNLVRIEGKETPEQLKSDFAGYSFYVDSKTGLISYENVVYQEGKGNTLEPLQRRIVFTVDLTKFNGYTIIEDDDSLSEKTITYKEEDEETETTQVKALLLACGDTYSSNKTGYYKNTKSEYTILNNMLSNILAKSHLNKTIKLETLQYNAVINSVSKYDFIAKDQTYTISKYQDQLKNYEDLIMDKFNEYDVIVLKIPDNATPNLFNDLCLVQTTDDPFVVPDDKKLIIIGNFLLGYTQDLVKGSVAHDPKLTNLDKVDKNIYFIGNNPSDYLEGYILSNGNDGINVQNIKGVNSFIADIVPNDDYISEDDGLIVAPKIQFGSESRAFVEPMYYILLDNTVSTSTEYLNDSLIPDDEETVTDSLINYYDNFEDGEVTYYLPLIYLTFNHDLLNQSYIANNHLQDKVNEKIIEPEKPSYALCNYNLLDPSISTDIEKTIQESGSNYFFASISYRDILERTINVLNDLSKGDLPASRFTQADLNINHSEFENEK